MKPRRPVLRYHGGKWKLAQWIIGHFPKHNVYVEPFGGAASVLLQKPRSYGEVYNDLDDEVVNVFSVLRDPVTADDLCRRITLTPFARKEFRAAYEEPSDAIDRAYKMIVRSFMGFGSASMTRMHATGFRSNSNRSGVPPSVDWSNWPWQVKAITARLRGVVIENRDALKVIEQHDSPATLFYVDPPYVWSTRSSLALKNGNRGHYYRHDMDDDGHRRIADALRSVAGMVVVSGYKSPLYEELYGDWPRFDKETHADGARDRLESLWISPRCHEARPAASMFAEEEATA